MVYYIRNRFAQLYSVQTHRMKMVCSISLLTEVLTATAIAVVFADDVTLEPEVSCNKPMIPEGESLSCECRVKMNPPGTPIPTPPPMLSWPGHSNTSLLTVNSIQRNQNGTVFTCVMERQGMENKTATRTLLVAFGPSQDKLKIKCYESPLVTDGSRTMALSCEASDVYPTPFYGWGGLCESNTPNCTCQPQPDQDGQNILCTVTNAVTIQSETLSYTVHLKYPPMEPPVIVANTDRAVLSAGDILTCTVRGGKPPVASVNFNCTNPTLSDQPDLVGENSVSSSVIVDTADSGETPAVCHCTAVWGPEPHLYQKNDSKEYQLKFKASVTNFTMNETTKLTVTEDDEPELVFYCDVAARPAADVSLLHENKTRLAFSSTTNGTGSDHYRAMHKLSSVRCEDTGLFVCEADNGLSTPSKKSVQLDVLGRPRLYGNLINHEPDLTDKGLVITLVANPVPNDFQCAYLGRETKDNQECQSDIMFKTECVRHQSVGYLVDCSVHPVNVSDGLYDLSISNHLGNYTWRFDVKQAVSLEVSAPTDSKRYLVPVFVLLFIGVMVAAIGIFIFFKRRRLLRKSPCIGCVTKEEHDNPEAAKSRDSISMEEEDGKPEPPPMQVKIESPTEDAERLVDCNQASSSSNKCDNSAPVEQNACPTSEAGAGQPSDAEEPECATSVSEFCA